MASRVRSLAPILIASLLLPAVVAPLASAGAVDQAMSQVLGEFLALSDPSEERLLLEGKGQATAERFGAAPTACGEVPFVLEASRKPFTLEPTVTFAYAGGKGSGNMALPCAMGHLHQPVVGDWTGDFGGAWTASQTWARDGWSLEVGAPVDGKRTVSYTWWHQDGSEDTFDGVLTQYHGGSATSAN